MAKNVKNKPSILNWIGTLILYAIPVVNLISLILFAIFAKSSAKRNFAIAGIILMVACFVLICAAFMAFPDFFSRMAEIMRQSNMPAPTL
mgnify:CR=1 FL=1